MSNSRVTQSADRLQHEANRPGHDSKRTTESALLTHVGGGAHQPWSRHLRNTAHGRHKVPIVHHRHEAGDEDRQQPSTHPSALPVAGQEHPPQALYEQPRRGTSLPGGSDNPYRDFIACDTRSGHADHYDQQGSDTTAIHDPSAYNSTNNGITDTHFHWADLINWDVAGYPQEIPKDIEAAIPRSPTFDVAQVVAGASQRTDRLDGISVLPWDEELLPRLDTRGNTLSAPVDRLHASGSSRLAHDGRFEGQLSLIHRFETGAGRAAHIHAQGDQVSGVGSATETNHATSQRLMSSGYASTRSDDMVYSDAGKSFDWHVPAHGASLLAGNDQYSHAEQATSSGARHLNVEFRKAISIPRSVNNHSCDPAPPMQYGQPVLESSTGSQSAEVAESLATPSDRSFDSAVHYTEAVGHDLLPDPEMKHVWPTTLHAHRIPFENPTHTHADSRHVPHRILSGAPLPSDSQDSSVSCEVHLLAIEKPWSSFNFDPPSTEPPVGVDDLPGQQPCNVPERPFQCSWVDCTNKKGFPTTGDLRHHMNKHDEEKTGAHPCPDPTCKKRFRYPKDGKRHYRSAHEPGKQARFGCTHCGQLYLRKDNCSRHEKICSSKPSSHSA